MELIKPTDQTELQTLLNYVLITLGDKGKMQIVIEPRLKRSYAYACTPHYIRYGRRKIVISKLFFGYSTIHQLIDTLIHEIAHFKHSRTRKLRKLWLKNNWGYYAYGPTARKLIKKHHHTKRFKRLVEKLQLRFLTNHNFKQPLIILASTPKRKIKSTQKQKEKTQT